MSRAIRKIFYFTLLLFYTSVAFADWIPLRMSVDGISIGDINSFLDEKGKPSSINGAQLLDLIGNFLQQDKTKRITNSFADDGALTLDNLERVGITHEYNEKELRLTLIIPLEIRALKDFPVLITRQRSGLGLYDKPFSGYLNFLGSVGYNTTSTPLAYTDQKNPLVGQFELVQNLNFATLETTEHYTEYDEKPWQRIDTALVHDFEKEQIRLRVGDIYTGVQGFQTALSAGGVQLQRQFNIYPNKSSINKRSSNIQVKNNSLLEIFVNGNLISRLRVTPGPYNLKDLPLVYGGNKLKIILTDDFGRKEEFEVDMLFDDQILAEGVSDFSYQIGQPSYFFQNEKRYYNNNLSSLFHKYGLTNETTLFLNYQNYLSSNLFGSGLGFLTHYGTHFFDVGYYTDNEISSALASRWRYNSPELDLPALNRIRFFASFESRTKEFKTITATVPVYTVFSEKYDFNFQKQLTELSSLSLGFTKILGQNFGNNEFSQRVSFQSQLAKNWRFDMTYNWADQLSDSNQVLLTLNWQDADGKAQAAIAHSTIDNASSLRINKNSRFNYNDFQLSMYGAKQKSKATGEESQTVDMGANYYSTKYEMRLQASGNSTSTNLNTSGILGFGSALAWTTDSFSVSRPITDSFVAIEAEGMGPKQYLTIPNGLEKDNLFLSNNENFVFANLTSYSERVLQLDSTGLGSSGHLDREAYILHPKYRAGLFVPLKVIRSLTLRGKLASTNPEQTNYAYGKILTSDGKIFSSNFFTDESGNFLIDGLSYGKYQIELSDKRLKKIFFELLDTGESDRAREAGEIEDADSSVYEMGTIKVEKETGM